MRTLVVAVALVLPAVASAGDDPTMSVDADGTIVTQVNVQATPAQVRAMLADPVATTWLSKEVRSVDATPRGACSEVHATVSAAPLADMQYSSLVCPTATGFRQTLLSSPDLSQMSSEWTLSPSAGGTSITYRLHSQINGPLPEAFVRPSVERSALATVKALVARLL